VIATCLPLAIDKWTDWSLSLDFYEPNEVTPIDMTGWTGQMEIRPTTSSSTIISTLSTANGKIVITLPNQVLLKLPFAETSAIVESVGNYTLQFRDSLNQLTSWLKGPINFIASNTRIP
jgi:hypothetical protein